MKKIQAEKQQREAWLKNGPGHFPLAAKNGFPILPGSSQAGKLRRWLVLKRKMSMSARKNRWQTKRPKRKKHSWRRPAEEVFSYLFHRWITRAYLPELSFQRWRSIYRHIPMLNWKSIKPTTGLLPTIAERSQRWNWEERRIIPEKISLRSVITFSINRSWVTDGFPLYNRREVGINYIF